jgi:hypothetical protein
MERIRLIAQQRHLSVSEVVRRAIEDYSKRGAICHPYELMKDLIGVVHGGNANRSESIGRRFTALLKTRRAHR